MVESIRRWIINLSTIIIFITAVKLILPNNPIKKYAKYVLGLLILLTMLNPILKFLNKDFNAKDCSIKAEKYFNSKEYEKDLKKYKKDNFNKTIKVFKKNLSIECEKKLKINFPKEDFEVFIDVKLNEEDKKININKIKIGVREKGVKKVKSVVISKDEQKIHNKNQLSEEKIKNIKNVIEKEFGINRDEIIVYAIDK